MGGRRPLYIISAGPEAQAPIRQVHTHSLSLRGRLWLALDKRWESVFLEFTALQESLFNGELQTFDPSSWFCTCFLFT